MSVATDVDLADNLTPGEQRSRQVRRSKQARLAPFRDVNGKSKKLTASDRRELISEQFPSVDQLDWGEALSRNDDLFARIMRDIIKLDQSEPGKSGPRSNNLDYERGVQTFRQLMGDDFSMCDFRESFASLTSGYSRRHVARKTTLSLGKVQRLLQGEDEPTEYDLRVIAEAFGKHPSFFVEYRQWYIINHLAEALLKEPESTIAYYQKIIGVQA